MKQQKVYGPADEATVMQGQIMVTLNNTRVIDTSDGKVVLEISGVMHEMPELTDAMFKVEEKLEPIEFYTLEAAMMKAMKQINLLRALAA